MYNGDFIDITSDEEVWWSPLRWSDVGGFELQAASFSFSGGGKWAKKVLNGENSLMVS